MTGAHATRAAVWGLTSTGAAVRGSSTGGYRLEGYADDGYGVRGQDFGTTQARGYGGYFTSINGVCVYGYSSGATTVSNAYAPGVYGRSQNGSGVYGVSEGSRSAVYGESVDGNGIYVRSTNANGVYGSNDIGVCGGTGGATSSDCGVYGTGRNGIYAIRGKKSDTGPGLGVSGYNAGTGAGISGWCASASGVDGITSRADGNWGLCAADNIHYVSVTTLGAEMQVVQNGDTSLLEVGDVVKIAGMGAPLGGGLPSVILVRRARVASSSAVLGGVAGGDAREWLTVPPEGFTDPDNFLLQSQIGPIAPGETLQVVVRGPAKVKVAGGPSSRATFYPAARQQSLPRAPLVSIEGFEMARPGSVLGKALETWAGGEGLICVYVTLQ